MRTIGLVVAALAPALAFAHGLPAAHAHPEGATALPVGALAIAAVALVPIVVRAVVLIRARRA